MVGLLGVSVAVPEPFNIGVFMGPLLVEGLVDDMGRRLGGGLTLLASSRLYLASIQARFSL